MSNKRLITGLLVAAIAAITAGLALAQDDGGSGEAGGEAEMEVRQRADLSGPEQIAEAERVQGHGSQISHRVQAMLDEARRERDIIRVTCLNDKLTQVNANLRTLEQRIENLRSSVQAQDAGGRNHQFTVVTVLGQKFNVLEQEANQCLGQDIFETGATRVTTTIDPSTPDEDPTHVPEMPPPEVPFIPPPCSPCI